MDVVRDVRAVQDVPGAVQLVQGVVHPVQVAVAHAPAHVSEAVPDVVDVVAVREGAQPPVQGVQAVAHRIAQVAVRHVLDVRGAVHSIAQGLAPAHVNHAPVVMSLAPVGVGMDVSTVVQHAVLIVT